MKSVSKIFICFFIVIGLTALWFTKTAPHQWAMVMLCGFVVLILSTDLKKDKQKRLFGKK